MSIAQSMTEIIQEEMARHGATVLRSVTVHIGQMSAIVPESLSFCFEVITANTELEGARLHMEVIPLRGRCRDCLGEFDIPDYHFVCPMCSGKDVEVISGQDLSIVEMEVQQGASQ